jgi:hypothetical protein
MSMDNFDKAKDGIYFTLSDIAKFSSKTKCHFVTIIILMTSRGHGTEGAARVCTLHCPHTKRPQVSHPLLPYQKSGRTSVTPPLPPPPHLTAINIGTQLPCVSVNKYICIEGL